MPLLRSIFGVAVGACGVEGDPCVLESCWVIQQSDLDMYLPLSIDRMRNRGVRRGRIRVRVMAGWARIWSRCIPTTAPSCFASDFMALVNLSSWHVLDSFGSHPYYPVCLGSISRVGSRGAVSIIGLSATYQTHRLRWGNNTYTSGTNTAEEYISVYPTPLDSGDVRLNFRSR